MELPSWSQRFHPAFLSSLVVAPRPDYISQDAPLLLLLTTPHSSIVYTPYVKNNEQLCRQTDIHSPPEKKTNRFGIHKVLESRLTSASLFMASAVTSSADLLPGKAWAQTRPASPLWPPQVPKGQRQINRQDASGAAGALARTEPLPLSAVSGD